MAATFFYVFLLWWAVSASASGSDKVIVRIENHHDEPLHFIEHYLSWGKAMVPPPLVIQPNSTGLMIFEKASLTWTGVAGFVTYGINGIVDNQNRTTLSIFFSNPFWDAFHKNWIGVQFHKNFGKSAETLWENALYEEDSKHARKTTSISSFVNGKSVARIWYGKIQVVAITGESSAVQHVRVNLMPKKGPTTLWEKWMASRLNLNLDHF